MKVLVACEFSGIVRDAFVRKGHDAYSCDLLPGEGYYLNRHIRGDVRKVLSGMYEVSPGKLISPSGWDLLIAHPPCTYLANSGVRWLYNSDKTRNKKRWALMREASDFFRLLLDAPIYRIAVENPVIHRHADLPKHSQTIQPWQFGHGETKRTCFWLKNLPPLEPTKVVKGRHARVHLEPPHPDRWKRRSITYPGIADAMASQWGSPNQTEEE